MPIHIALQSTKSKNSLSMHFYRKATCCPDPYSCSFFFFSKEENTSFWSHRDGADQWPAVHPVMSTMVSERIVSADSRESSSGLSGERIENLTSDQHGGELICLEGSES